MLRFLNVCVSNLTYSVRNNHVPCCIAVSVLSIGTNRYTLSYHMHQFQKMVTEHKISLSA